MKKDYEINENNEINENLKSQIFLIGFMASGKSTVGPVLAAELDRPFIDLDRLIEEQAGCAIAELFGNRGEASFRRMESEILRAAAGGEPAVIAPGGGAITRPENRRLMSRMGISIWLDPPFELCWRRIQSDRIVRPLAPDEETARARHRERLPFYRQVEMRIGITEDQTPVEIARIIIDNLKKDAVNR
jgi:shikimate kinase